MAKALTITGMVVALLLFVLFALNLAMDFPFGRASLLMNVSVVIYAIILGYMSWSAYRDQA